MFSVTSIVKILLKCLWTLKIEMRIFFVHKTRYKVEGRGKCRFGLGELNTEKFPSYTLNIKPARVAGNGRDKIGQKGRLN